MSLTIELAPEEESILRHRAAAEGITPDRLVARLLALDFPKPPTGEPEWKSRLRSAQQYAQQAFLASGKTEEQLGDEIDTAIRAYRQEYRSENTAA